YAISVFYILFLVILNKLNHSKITLYMVIIFGTISNTIVFGTLATVVDRFQSKIGWILIFLAFSIFIDRNLLSIKGLYNKYQLNS
ncbi:MAG: hypothetical protein K8S16_02695, partial [Bacteroidales bacterium]|nr:hypothetical protein [Bacteroidales bacterium]